MRRHIITITEDVPGAAWGVKRYVRRAIRAALRAQGVSAPCRIDVLITDDDGIHSINLEQRNVDSATDVLSFPLNELTAGEFDLSRCERDPGTAVVLLGDMVISSERCRAQAKEYGHSFAREISYLTVHSVLHLLGYDHLDEGPQKKQMRAREDAIMDELGL